MVLTIDEEKEIVEIFDREYNKSIIKNREYQGLESCLSKTTEVVIQFDCKSILLGITIGIIILLLITIVL